MKIASIICTVLLLGLLWLVLSQPKRDGFVILLDESYRAEIVEENENLQNFPLNQSYEVASNEKLRRAVEEEENFTPESIFQVNDVIYLIDGKRGKLSSFTASDGLKPIAVFGGKLKKLQTISSDNRENIYVSIQSDSKNQGDYLIKLTK